VYDYHKTVEADTFDSFYDKYGPESVFSTQTGSKNLNLLNSGKQLYWLKYKRPKIFNKICFTLHLPQYLSFVFTGEMFTEFTSIGCHTDLWDFEKKDYHHWVKAEGLDSLFPSIVKTKKTVIKTFGDQKIIFGIGIHDSSSALLTYLLKGKESFILLSTGTWCINFNPFSKESLFNEKQIADGATAYMKINGSAVNSSRLFMGEEHRLKFKQLVKHFKKSFNNYSDLSVNNDLIVSVSEESKNHFHWKYLDNSNSPPKDKLDFPNFETAYYRLIKELIDLLKIQIQVICKKLPKKMYVDGGFSDNKIFLALLKKEFPDQVIKAKSSSFACALGAAKLIDL
ncbi:MAG: carbohydrate kinase, partial [Flavobacteriaceae bacterium]